MVTEIRRRASNKSTGVIYPHAHTWLCTCFWCSRYLIWRDSFSYTDRYYAPVMLVVHPRSYSCPLVSASDSKPSEEHTRLVHGRSNLFISEVSLSKLLLTACFGTGCNVKVLISSPPSICFPVPRRMLNSWTCGETDTRRERRLIVSSALVGSLHEWILKHDQIQHYDKSSHFLHWYISMINISKSARILTSQPSFDLVLTSPWSLQSPEDNNRHSCDAQSTFFFLFAPRLNLI